MLYVYIVFMVEQDPNSLPSRGNRMCDGPMEKEWERDRSLDISNNQKASGLKADGRSEKM